MARKRQIPEHVRRLLKDRSGIRLDIGGGENPNTGFVNIDMRDLPAVDIVWDIEDIPWPLPDNCVLVAACSHLVEHINPHKFGFVRFMDELWRVMKPDGQVAIATPYAGSPGYWQDPTHVNPCNEATWAYFDPLEPRTQGQLYAIYRPRPWKIEMNTWHETGNMEVLLRKRRDDRSYHARR